MSSLHRLTRSFRTLSALLYLLNVGCALHFMIHHPKYLNIVVSAFVCGISIVMLMVTLEAPRLFLDRLERNIIGLQLFTFRGRYVFDLYVALFLFAMKPWGILLGLATLLLIFGIRFLGVKQPDAFNEIFRQVNNHTAATPSLSSPSLIVGNGTDNLEKDPNRIMTNGHAMINSRDNMHDGPYHLESEYDTPVAERR